MSNASARMSTLNDDAWDDLLSFNEKRRCIPIVGPDLRSILNDANVDPPPGFLTQVDVRTRISVSADKFVVELDERWQAPVAAPGGTGHVRFLPPACEMPDTALFVSNAPEDRPAVQQIKAALESAGITTRFNIGRLDLGDDFDRQIEGNVRCSYCIPGRVGRGSAAPGR